MHLEQGAKEAEDSATAGDDEGSKEHTAADALHPGRASQQMNVSSEPVHVSLSTGLSLLSKRLSGACSNAGSSGTAAKGSDQLRPIVQRFLESLPSIGKAWSFDAASTVHSLAEVEEDSDSTSCYSSSTQQPKAPTSFAARECQSLRQTAQQCDCASRPKARDGTPLRSKVQVQLFRTALPATQLGAVDYSQLETSTTANCFGIAESVGSAPTPSPVKAEPDTDAPRCSGDLSRRRGVFVGNLPGDVNERALVELFSRCGRIDRLWIARNASNQASLGYGFVVFDAYSGPRATERAERELNGIALRQQEICVRVSNRMF